MRPELRAQLRRNKARTRSYNRLWSRVSGINVPWTVGQRKWINGKIRVAINEAFAAFKRWDKPDTIIMSADAYEAYQDALSQDS